jgi:hypothetical protein
MDQFASNADNIERFIEPPPLTPWVLPRLSAALAER